MADPLSISASIIAVVQLTATIIGYLKDVQDAPQDRINFLVEVSGLHSLLITLQNRVQEAKSGDPWVTGLAAFGFKGGPIDQLKSGLELLASKLEPMTGIKEVGRRLIWRFNKAEVIDILTKIERVKTSITLALSNNILSLSRAIKEETSEIKAGLEDDKTNQRDQESQKIANWLSSLNFKATQSDVFEKRQEGTGNWFLESAEFLDWRDGISEVLWCPGIPGAGKTVIASTVINHLQTLFQGENVAILCIYCNYQEQTEQTASGLVASLLKQLVQDRGTASDNIKSFYRPFRFETRRPSLSELTNVLKEELGTYAKVLIVVDALDECSADNGTRADLLHRLRSLGKTVNLMVTSRDLLSIAGDFEGAKRLYIHANNGDIRRYIEGRVARAPRRHLKTLQESIVTKIVESIKGMFLLARLHMDSLMSKHSLAAVRKALENLPTEVDATYDEAMERIERQSEDDRDLAKEVISWITYAFRPLSVEELQHALSITLDMTDMDFEAIIDTDILTSVCAGLVVIDEESNTCRLVHYTTQQYFERQRESRFPDAQAGIASKCLTYLTFDVFSTKFCYYRDELKSFREEYALLDYAASHWGNHAKAQEEKCKHTVLRLLQDTRKWAFAIQVLLLHLGPEYDGYTAYETRFVERSPLMHLLSFFGLLQTIKLHLEHGAEPDVKDDRGRTPLSWAAGNGQEAVVGFLLERDDVQADSRETYGRTPLSRASQHGHEAVVKLLLGRDDVELDSQNVDGHTPLLFASTYGHVGVVKQLLSRGSATPEVEFPNDASPLFWANLNKHEEVVKLLEASGQRRCGRKEG